MMLKLRRARIPVFKQVTELKAEGNDRLERVSLSSKGHQETISTESLLIHNGVVPGIHLSRLAGCELKWNDQQMCWQPDVDSLGASSSGDVFIAGDGNEITGARAARMQGGISALQIVQQFNLISESKRDQQASRLRTFVARHTAIRPFLDAIYRPSEQFFLPADETIVFHCE
jgi:pyruvate/2-oxoglutarate dehydrogenase complex dihydrolipoamide dehydrogenase (E3) component